MQQQHKHRRPAGLFLAAFMAAWVAFGLLTEMVFAISDPDTPPEIISVTAFADMLEADDLLVLVFYNLPYASTPTESISDTYLAKFQRGTTELNAVEPFPYNDKGYGKGLLSFYWSAAAVVTDSIEFSNTNNEDYKITLQGKTGAFPGSVPSVTVTAITWDTGGIAGLESYIISNSGTTAGAYTLEQDAAWIANAQDLISNPVGVNQLTTTGAEYFSNAVPQLRSMVPGLFASGVTAVGFTEDTFSDSHNKSIATFWDTNGAWVDQRFQTLADRYEAPKAVITSLAALFCMFLIVWALAKALGDNSQSWQFGMLSLAVTLPLFGAINWIPMDVVLAVASIGVLGIIWTMFLRRTA